MSSHSHGCTLFGLLAEVRGNDRRTSVDFCRCCDGLLWNPWVPRASATALGISTANATVVATACATILSVANSVVPTMATLEVRGNCHGSFRGNCVETSPAIRGHRHGNAAITTEVRGSPRQLPRQFPRMSNRSNFNGHLRPSAAIVTAILRYAAITTDVRRSSLQFPQHVPRFCPWQTPPYQSCPRKSVWVRVRVRVSSIVLKDTIM